MRYDVEVSGFPSQHAGHLCLLRLKEDDYEYPQAAEFDWSFAGKNGHFKGTKTEHDRRVAELGPADSQVGQGARGRRRLLAQRLGPGTARLWPRRRANSADRPQPPPGVVSRAADKLPDYAMPPFDGIGANEYVVDAVHGVCDFISAVDTPVVWELNIWYHTLNCGMTTRISGETDFPCIYGDSVGLGRIYVKLDPGQAEAAARLRRLGAMASATAAATAATASPTWSISRSTAWASARRATRTAPACWRRRPATSSRIKVNAAALLNEEPDTWNGTADQATSASIKSRTGTSSGPASATRARCRSS